MIEKIERVIYKHDTDKINEIIDTVNALSIVSSSAGNIAEQIQAYTGSLVSSVTTGVENGTISVTKNNNTIDVSIKGLKSAAFTDTEDYAPAAHTQGSDTINKLVGYSKASSVSAITGFDTLNSALGKLEKALDEKQIKGSYLSTTGVAADSSKLGGIAAADYALKTDIPSGSGGGSVNFIGINSNDTDDDNYDGGGAVASDAIAIGKSAKVNGDEGIAIGVSAYAGSDNAIVIGKGTNASCSGNIIIGNESYTSESSYDSIAIGNSVELVGGESVALGPEAKTNNDLAIAIGKETVADGEESVAIGKNANSGNYGDIAIGNDTSATGWFSVAIGGNHEDNSPTKAEGASSVAIGHGAIVYENGTGTVSIGKYSRAYSEKAIAIGDTANVRGDCDIVIGSLAKTDYKNDNGASHSNIVIGQEAKIAADGYTAEDSIAIGSFALVDEGSSNSIAIGTNTKVDWSDSIAIGSGTECHGSCSIAIGDGTKVYDDYCDFSVAIGHGAEVTAENAIAIGPGAKVNYVLDGIAIGQGAEITGGDNCVAIGNGSVANEYNEFSIGKPANGGESEFTRRITHVSAGINDSDAVTLGQVRAMIAAALQ